MAECETPWLRSECYPAATPPPEVSKKGQRWAATTDLAGQFIHQGHNGVLEERGGGQRSLGDLGDAQVAIWPHLLQDLAGTAKRLKKKKNEKGTAPLAVVVCKSRWTMKTIKWRL